MESFRLFFESGWEITPESIYLSPKSIYDFYFLYTYMQTRGMDQMADFLIKEFAPRIRRTYIRVFSNMIKAQLEKYGSRRRTDPDFNIPENPTPAQLNQLMGKTFRSDMKRRNDRWMELTKWLEALDNSKSIKDTFFAIDRINNTTHNTQENIMSKFQNASSLLTAFDNAHQFKDLNNFKPYISKEYAKLL